MKPTFDNWQKGLVSFEKYAEAFCKKNNKMHKDGKNWWMEFLKEWGVLAGMAMIFIGLGIPLISLTIAGIIFFFTGYELIKQP